MLFKLSLKNIKKSIKDYSIYFFTLVVTVAIFYIFNSLDAQQSILIMSESKTKIIQSLVMSLGYISIFISLVLGFLIIYTNNFLIKRRKKEFGLYLTLGMSKRKVSLILVIETLLVGLISLLVGLILGVVLSQFLSGITAKLFEADMERFAFVFSSGAVLKTMIYFGVIFLLVMIFNVISLSKNKLINLLTAGRKNEKIKIRNKFLTFVTFIAAVGLLGYAYYKLFNGALFEIDNSFLYMIIAGAIGTFLLFFSGAGFFLRVTQLIKKVYYKNLNMFVLKQVNNKVNTTVFSTTIICLMLLLTIGILSGAMSLMNAFNSSMLENNKTDFTIMANKYYGIVEDGEVKLKEAEEDVTDVAPKQEYFSETVKEYVYYNVYEDEEFTVTDLLDQKTKENLERQYGGAMNLDSNLDIMTESDYNKILELYGDKKLKVNLGENEYILTSNSDEVKGYFEGFYKAGSSIIINGKELSPVSKDIVNVGFQNYSAASNFGTVIVDDSIIEGLAKSKSIIIGNYVATDDIESLEKDFMYNVSCDGNAFTYITKLDMQETNIGIKAIAIFMGLYLGVIFAISSATILAIGQLSESSDNKERYKILNKIGADDKMVRKALFSQIAIAFVLPLAVALVHAFFGLRELNSMIVLLGNADLTSSILVTALFVIFVYGGYFLATYLCSKNIIKE